MMVLAAQHNCLQSIFCDNGSWNELITGQSSIDALSDVDTTTQALQVDKHLYGMVLQHLEAYYNLKQCIR